MRPLLPALLGALLIAVPAAAQTTLDDAIQLYLAGNYEKAASVLDSITDATHFNPRARAWQAEAYYRLGDYARAEQAIGQALEADGCQAAAHNVRAAIYAQEPWDAGSRAVTWEHAQQAVKCDPEDGNAWLTYWISGVMRRDSIAQATAQRRIAEIGFIPDAIMEQARWMLRAAPRGAVLFTAGDWDYFPLMVAQSQEGLRPDVTVAMLGMLEVPWYVRELAGRAGWPVPSHAAKAEDDWMPVEELADSLPQEPSPFTRRTGVLWARASLAGGRPLAIAATAPTDFVGDVAYLRWRGPVYTLLPWEQAPPDTVLSLDEVSFAASMRALDVSRLGGPIVHPTDRSPIRRTASAPADVILLPVLYYGVQNLEAGRMQDVRQALAWADALIATGASTGRYAANVDELRAAVDAESP
jgi:hypothetical protein